MFHGMKLSPRQWEIAKLISKGYSNKDIAAELGLTVGSVKEYLWDIRIKMTTVDPDVKQRSYRALLGQWVKCYLCSGDVAPGA